MGVVVALGALLGACGSGDEDAVKNVARNANNAIVNGDGAKACDLIAGEVRAGFETLGEEGGCEAGIEYIGQVPGGTAAVDGVFLKNAVAKDAKVDGKRATVTLENSKGTQKMTLEKANDQWRVVDVGDVVEP
jgi:hypothetical protein